MTGRKERIERREEQYDLFPIDLKYVESIELKKKQTRESVELYAERLRKQCAERKSRRARKLARARLIEKETARLKG